MRHRIYNALKRHANTVLIALVVSSLASAGGAYAVGRITFNQIQGKVSGPQIKDGVIDYQHLSHPLRRKIDLVETTASNEALGATARAISEQTDRSLRALEAKIEAEYVHK